jgi:hypothetical protein
MSTTTQYGDYGDQPCGGTDTLVRARSASALRDMIVLLPYEPVIQHGRGRAGISPHFFSTKNSDRNVRSLLKTDHRCHVDSTINRGGIRP